MADDSVGEDCAPQVRHHLMNIHHVEIVPPHG
jgi:hypothetical protein